MGQTKKTRVYHNVTNALGYDACRLPESLAKGKRVMRVPGCSRGLFISYECSAW